MRRNIEIKNIEKTSLDYYGLLRVIKKFSKSKKDILLSFDNRISCYGWYVYNSRKKRHEIKISPIIFQFKDPIAKVYELIGTILHELKHIDQQEKTQRLFMSKQFSDQNIRASEACDYFSTFEIEARIFEQKKLLSAVEFYWKNCRDDVK